MVEPVASVLGRKVKKDDKVVWGWPLRRDRSFTFSRPLNVECHHHQRRGEEEKNLSLEIPARHEIASNRTIGIPLDRTGGISFFRSSGFRPPRRFLSS